MKICLRVRTDNYNYEYDDDDDDDDDDAAYVVVRWRGVEARLLKLV